MSTPPPPPPTARLVYGNIGYNEDAASDDKAVILSGSKENGSYEFEVSLLNTGLWLVQFYKNFFNPPAVVLTQIYHSSAQLTDTEDPQWNTNPQWGNTRDNAVLVGISVKEFKLITGDQNGVKQNRMFGFIAVGAYDPSAEGGYVDPYSWAAGLKQET